MEVVKKVMTVILFFSLFTISVNIVKIMREYTDLQKIGNCAIKHAEKNGGFRDETVELLNEMLEARNLENAVKDFTFNPGINVDVQKREEFGFGFTYIAEYTLPFTGTQSREVILNFSGYSHQYFKP